MISNWLDDNVQHIKPGGHVLDLACGRGRHSLFMLEQGFKVTAVDQNITSLAESLRTLPSEQQANCQLIQADLEGEMLLPLLNVNQAEFHQTFDAIIVTNYLYRPLLDFLPSCLSSDGILLYETFMLGNEKYGRPKSPDFLLRENELKEIFQDQLEILNFEQGLNIIAVTNAEAKSDSVKQAICARKLKP